MGAPMARRLAEAGNDVRAWNRTREKAESLADVATVTDTPAQAVDGADIVLTMLLDAAAVREVITAAAPHAGRVWLQMSTVGEDVEDLITLAEERGLDFVDAPVLGTKPTAEQGALTVIAASRAVDQGRVAPLFDAVGGRTVWLDEPGQASRLKLVINTWVIGLLGVLGDTIALAEALDVDPAAFMDTIEGGAVGAPYARLKGTKMVDRDYAAQFPAAGARKDLGLILEAADRAGLPARVTGAVRDAFDAAIGAGHRDEDMAAVVEASRPPSG